MAISVRRSSDQCPNWFYSSYILISSSNNPQCRHHIFPSDLSSAEEIRTVLACYTRFCWVCCRRNTCPSGSAQKSRPRGPVTCDRDAERRGRLRSSWDKVQIKLSQFGWSCGRSGSEERRVPFRLRWVKWWAVWRDSAGCSERTGQQRRVSEWKSNWWMLLHVLKKILKMCLFLYL